VGRRRPGQNPSLVAALLPKHPGVDIRRGLQRQGESGGSGTRAAQHAARRRPQRRHTIGVCQQTRPSQRDERVGSHKQTRAESVEPEKVVHPVYLRHARQWSIRRVRLAVQ